MEGSIAVAGGDRLFVRVRILGAFFVGACIGGVLLLLSASTLGLIGREEFASTGFGLRILVLFMSLLTVLEAWELFPVPRPTARRQVCAGVLIRSPQRAAWQWGAELGAGVFTYINTWAFWGLVALAALAADPTVGALSGLTYATMRAAQPVMVALAGGSRGPSATLAMYRLDRRYRVPLLAGIALLLAVVVP